MPVYHSTKITRIDTPDDVMKRITSREYPDIQYLLPSVPIGNRHKSQMKTSDIVAVRAGCAAKLQERAQ